MKLTFEHLACVGTLCRIHRSHRKDPFGMYAAIFAGKPKPIGFCCRSCGKAVRRTYTSAEVTGLAFAYYACGCTMVSVPGHLADPTPEQWKEVVTEAKQLPSGAVKVHTAAVEESTDVHGNN